MQQEFRDRVKNITQLLLEVAAGNFCYAVPPVGKDKELDVLLEWAKFAADQLRGSLYRRGRILSYPSYQYLVQWTFLLDEEFCIEGLAAGCSFLPVELQNIDGLPFAALLDPDSLVAWEQSCASIRRDKHFHALLPFTFIAPRLRSPAFCTVSRLLHSSKILVSAVTIVADTSVKTNPILLNQDPFQIHLNEIGIQIHEFILSHLEAPLPSIKELAKIFSTNEFYLKNIFRELFETSIYRFYNDERLKRAHLLIQQTDLSLGEISDMCGFGSYNNFSKAFTKRFGYPAKSLRLNKER